eukprot:6190347-Pleurochrysis_carterae.AAC.1
MGGNGMNAAGARERWGTPKRKGGCAACWKQHEARRRGGGRGRRRPVCSAHCDERLRRSDTPRKRGAWRARSVLHM